MGRILTYINKPHLSMPYSLLKVKVRDLVVALPLAGGVHKLKVAVIGPEVG